MCHTERSVASTSYSIADSSHRNSFKGVPASGDVQGFGLA
jgi:hypothetical protein